MRDPRLREDMCVAYLEVVVANDAVKVNMVQEVDLVLSILHMKKVMRTSDEDKEARHVPKEEGSWC